MLNRNAMLIAFVLFFSSIAFAGVSVERSIDGTVEAGGEIAIILSVDLGGEQPSSLIVTEEIPAGWQVVSSSPKAQSFESSLKFLLYGSKLKGGSASLEYVLKAPSDFGGSQAIMGSWKTLESNGMIGGDSSMLAMVEEKVLGPEPEVKPGVSPEIPAEPEKKDDLTVYVILFVLVLIVIIVAGTIIKKKNL